MLVPVYYCRHPGFPDFPSALLLGAAFVPVHSTTAAYIKSNVYQGAREGGEMGSPYLLDRFTGTHSYDVCKTYLALWVHFESISSTYRGLDMQGHVQLNCR